MLKRPFTSKLDSPSRHPNCLCEHWRAKTFIRLVKRRLNASFLFSILFLCGYLKVPYSTTTPETNTVEKRLQGTYWCRGIKEFARRTRIATRTKEPFWRALSISYLNPDFIVPVGSGFGAGSNLVSAFFDILPFPKSSSALLQVMVH